MRFLTLILICCLRLAAPSFAQTDSVWTTDRIANNTLCIYQSLDNRGQFTGGSGFIISHNGIYYLATATHIAKSLQADAKIGFPVAGGPPIEIDFLAITKSNNGKWINHPVADISLIQLSAPNKTIEQRLHAYAFPSFLISRQSITVPVQTQLIFLGYSLFDYIPKPLLSPFRGPVNNTALEQKSAFAIYKTLMPSISVATLLEERMVERKRFDSSKLSMFYYLDHQSTKGSEGSGVFYNAKTASDIKSKTYLIGIMHGTAKDKALPQFAAVTPSYYIWDLLNQI